MLIYLLAFVGRVLTILSPCILPVLPFVFARADQPFRRSGLPLLAGMALTFRSWPLQPHSAGIWWCASTKETAMWRWLYFWCWELACFSAINVSATGAEAAPDDADLRSPENYIG
jgi:hypothetical protein